MQIVKTEDLRFPIGHYSPPKNISEAQILEWIEVLAEAPGLLRQTVEGLSDRQLDTPYREDGWTIRQVVHHLVDSHINSLIRFRLALTEDKPTIRPYDEAVVAELPDARDGDIALSLDLLELIHQKLVIVLRNISSEQMAREFVHPEYGDVYRVDYYIGNYAWHSSHHIAHITSLMDREGW